VLNYNMWIPKYQQNGCRSSGHRLCEAGQRFNPKKIMQEAFLQGRGQLTTSPECPGAGVRYLPEKLFAKTEGPVRDMALYPEPLRQKKSCGSISEMDMLSRFHLLPGAYQHTFTPFLSNPAVHAPGPSKVSKEAVHYASTRKKTEGHSLSTKRYPSWRELKEMQDQYMA
jgi:hypothetical protein